MRTGLILDSRRTRPQAGPQQFALSVKTRFNPFRDSAGYTIVMRWQRRFKPFSNDQTLLFLTRSRMVHVFCEHLSPVDESACNPKPKSVRQTGRYPFNAEHNDLANDT